MFAKQIEMTVTRKSGKQVPISVTVDGLDVLEVTFRDGEPFRYTQEQAEQISAEVAERYFIRA